MLKVKSDNRQSQPRPGLQSYSLPVLFLHLIDVYFVMEGAGEIMIFIPHLNFDKLQ
jgi:hypothetical protein